MEVVVVFSVHVFVAHTDSGTRLIVTDDSDTVVPEAWADPVVGKPTQNEHLVRDLEATIHRC